MDLEQENRLLEKMRKGDEAAFKQVYDENRVKFLHFARKYGLEEDKSVDVYQDAYIVFYQNITSGKLAVLTSTLSTYLFGIGKFMVMKRLEKNKRTVHSEKILSVAGKNDVSLEGLLLEEEALTREQQLLKQHFAGLGEQCQKLLTLFYYRGLSIKEIIKAGGYSNENVVKSAKSRCLKTLKERMLKPL